MQKKVSPLPFKNLHPDLNSLVVIQDKEDLYLPCPPREFQELSISVQQVLCGITPTCSTLPTAFLPNTDRLLETFSAFRPHSTLTEGGKAFTKHCHRHVAFWGNAKGSAQVINARALERLEFILHHATWRNVFFLPGNFPVCEFRIESGYGARWSYDEEQADVCTFRGFLEPPQEDGHLLGWKQLEFYKWASK